MLSPAEDIRNSLVGRHVVVVVDLFFYLSVFLSFCLSFFLTYLLSSFFDRLLLHLSYLLFFEKAAMVLGSTRDKAAKRVSRHTSLQLQRNCALHIVGR